MIEPASAAFPSIGTTAQIVVGDAVALDGGRRILEDELRTIDRTCSRFRDDSELARVNDSAGRWIEISASFEQALRVALRAAGLTDGLVDPTVGGCLEALGYDRDFASIGEVRPRPVARPASDWRSVEVEPGRARIPRGVRLDLGATAKALAADRAAARAHHELGCGVLVNLGGDISVAGRAPGQGWRVHLAEDHRSAGHDGGAIVITHGGLATSSTTVRRWHRGDGWAHHIVDPRTGEPASVFWRTVTVTARTCVDANTASTAAVVMGEPALGWLSGLRLPSRLIDLDGRVVSVGRWPEEAA